MIPFVVPTLILSLSLYGLILSFSLYSLTGALLAVALSVTAIVFRKPFALFSAMMIVLIIYISGALMQERTFRIAESLTFGSILFVIGDLGFDLIALRTWKIPLRSYQIRLKSTVSTVLTSALVVICILTIGVNSAIVVPSLSTRATVIIGVFVLLVGSGLYVIRRRR